MGNCIKKESPTQWGGEDWGSPVPEKLFSDNDKVAKIEDEDQKGSSSTSSKEVKIKWPFGNPMKKLRFQQLLKRSPYS
ncbi:hypothetical protein CsSME_00018269 [Camellia sinensis var. sinensis]